MKAKRKRPKGFVVGYPRRGNRLLFGRGGFVGNDDIDRRTDDYCQLMTKAEARSAIASEDEMVIFEVVPVEV